MQPELHSSNDYEYKSGMIQKESVVFLGVSCAVHLVFLFILLFAPGQKSSYDGFSRFESIDVQLVHLNPQFSDPGQDSTPGGFVQDDAEPDNQPVFEDLRPDDGVPVKSRGSRDIDPSATLTLPKKAEPEIKAPSSSRFADAEKHKLVLPEDLKRQESKQQVSETVRRLEQETAAEDRRQASVRRRIDELEGEIGERTRASGGRGTGTGALSTGQSGRAGGVTSGQFTRMQIYQAEVRSMLRNNWVFSESLAGDARGLESRVVMTIMSNGEIKDVWFEKRSGNSYLDESAYKTVMKSDPLPPLPEGIPQYHLMVGFTPGGIN